jgi:hypothetical protein
VLDWIYDLARAEDKLASIKDPIYRRPGDDFTPGGQ